MFLNYCNTGSNDFTTSGGSRTGRGGSGKSAPKGSRGGKTSGYSGNSRSQSTSTSWGGDICRMY